MLAIEDLQKCDHYPYGVTSHDQCSVICGWIEKEKNIRRAFFLLQSAHFSSCVGGGKWWSSLEIWKLI